MARITQATSQNVEIKATQSEIRAFRESGASAKLIQEEHGTIILTQGQFVEAFGRTGRAGQEFDIYTGSVRQRDDFPQEKQIQTGESTQQVTTQQDDPRVQPKDRRLVSEDVPSQQTARDRFSHTSQGTPIDPRVQQEMREREKNIVPNDYTNLAEQFKQAKKDNVELNQYDLFQEDPVTGEEKKVPSGRGFKDDIKLNVPENVKGFDKNLPNLNLFTKDPVTGEFKQTSESHSIKTRKPIFVPTAKDSSNPIGTSTYIPIQQEQERIKEERRKKEEQLGAGVIAKIDKSIGFVYDVKSITEPVPLISRIVTGDRPETTKLEIGAAKSLTTNIAGIPLFLYTGVSDPIGTGESFVQYAITNPSEFVGSMLTPVVLAKFIPFGKTAKTKGTPNLEVAGFMEERIIRISPEKPGVPSEASIQTNIYGAGGELVAKTYGTVSPEGVFNFNIFKPKSGTSSKLTGVVKENVITKPGTTDILLTTAEGVEYVTPVTKGKPSLITGKPGSVSSQFSKIDTITASQKGKYLDIGLKRDVQFNPSKAKFKMNIEHTENIFTKTSAEAGVTIVEKTFGGSFDRNLLPKVIEKGGFSVDDIPHQNIKKPGAAQLLKEQNLMERFNRERSFRGTDEFGIGKLGDAPAPVTPQSLKPTLLKADAIDLIAKARESSKAAREISIMDSAEITRTGAKPITSPPALAPRGRVSILEGFGITSTRPGEETKLKTRLVLRTSDKRVQDMDQDLLIEPMLKSKQKLTFKTGTDVIQEQEQVLIQEPIQDVIPDVVQKQDSLTRTRMDTKLTTRGSSRFPFGRISSGFFTPAPPLVTSLGDDDVDADGKKKKKKKFVEFPRTYRASLIGALSPVRLKKVPKRTQTGVGIRFLLDKNAVFKSTRRKKKKGIQFGL